MTIIKSYVIIGAIIATLLGSNVNLVSASNKSDISKCWDDGYEDGKEGNWDTDREHECIRIANADDPNYTDGVQDNPYRDALAEGCIDGGYPKESCAEILH